MKILPEFTIAAATHPHQRIQEVLEAIGLLLIKSIYFHEISTMYFFLEKCYKCFLKVVSASGFIIILRENKLT